MASSIFAGRPGSLPVPRRRPARPLLGPGGLAKSLLDRGLAALLLLLLAPLLLLIAVVVRLDDPGPIFYRQWRHGLDGRPFRLVKFRTMRVGASEPGQRAGLAQAARGDARVTRAGRLLRRLSLDELPQLLNVLAGSMSLVGPRPLALAHNEHFAALLPGYAGRHRVRPGLTGWAQLHGLRGEIRSLDQMADRLAHDLWYIEHWSFTLDLRILLRTACGGFLHPSAY